MITVVKQITKIFTLLDYYNTYRQSFKEDTSMRLPLYSKIIHLFFNKCKNHVLEGNTLKLPIGQFKVVERIRDLNKKSVCQGTTNRERIKARKAGVAEEEVRKILFYRTNSSYHALAWKPISMFKPDALNFIFKEIRQIGRLIPKHFN